MFNTLNLEKNLKNVFILFLESTSSNDIFNYYMRKISVQDKINMDLNILYYLQFTI